MTNPNNRKFLDIKRGDILERRGTMVKVRVVDFTTKYLYWELHEKPEWLKHSKSEGRVLVRDLGRNFYPPK